MGLCESCEKCYDDSETPKKFEFEVNKQIIKNATIKNPDFVETPYEFNQMYKIGPLIGYGTTSKVYALKQKSNNLKLACKVIDKRRISIDANHEAILMQLRSETIILKKLNHPNIVKFYDVIETRTMIFIVMEYIKGEELFDYILNLGSLNEEKALTIMQGLLSAVNYLHSQGVIHRDIKAENLLILFDDKENVQVKMIDFGFSKILRYDLAGSFLGTGGYIAPEIRQHKQYSRSVDMWACGILLYVMLSGRLPFSTVVNSLPTQLSSEEIFGFSLQFPEERWSHVSQNAKDLIEALLTIDPIKRITVKEAINHPWVILFNFFIFYSIHFLKFNIIL